MPRLLRNRKRFYEILEKEKEFFSRKKKADGSAMECNKYEKSSQSVNHKTSLHCMHEVLCSSVFSHSLLRFQPSFTVCLFKLLFSHLFTVFCSPNLFSSHHHHHWTFIFNFKSINQHNRLILISSTFSYSWCALSMHDTCSLAFLP